jgi:hypothetical protein
MDVAGSEPTVLRPCQFLRFDWSGFGGDMLRALAAYVGGDRVAVQSN